MKKYNLSKVMKRAWEIKKQDEMNLFNLCLVMAWEEEKNSQMLFSGLQKVAIVKNGIICEYVGTEYDSECNYLTFNLWEKNGKKRIYMNDYKGRGCGYIDMNNRNEIVKPAGYVYAKETAEWFLNNYKIA